MKIIQRAIILLLMAGVFVCATSTTLRAESDAIAGAFLPINKNATGTKLSGPLSVYYHVVGVGTGGCLPFQVNMSFTMKLKKGTNSFAFASPAPITVCYENHALQVAIIQAFFANTVIPTLFPSDPSLPPPSFALKSVTDLTQDGSPQTAPPFFAIMDIELAVKE